ncbi:4'-phosphopantetheinyl transferase superfamily protein [Amycolatopsis sp. NPDC089917]|uniref:4'-phosphopantetheinyl transferase family protein n=1 Tax=Amycolatopsis sp. NPDC089917 TaxID=3155187 RepID=UPI00342D454B
MIARTDADEGVHVVLGPISDVLDHLPIPAQAAAEARALSDWRAKEYTAARALLVHALSTLDIDGTRLGKTAHGKPLLPGRRDVGISLSHSADMVAVAVAPGRDVGVDVQEAWLPSPGMMRRCCEPGLVADLTEAPPPERARRFARIWAAQEACVKATGEGIAGHPWKIPVHPGDRTGSWRALRWLHLRDADSAAAVCCAYTERTNR